MYVNNKKLGRILGSNVQGHELNTWVDGVNSQMVPKDMHSPRSSSVRLHDQVTVPLILLVIINAGCEPRRIIMA